MCIYKIKEEENQRQFKFELTKNEFIFPFFLRIYTFVGARELNNERTSQASATNATAKWTSRNESRKERDSLCWVSHKMDKIQFTFVSCLQKCMLSNSKKKRSETASWRKQKITLLALLSFALLWFKVAQMKKALSSFFSLTDCLAN